MSINPRRLRRSLAVLAAAGALILTGGCDIAPGSDTSSGVVTGKRLHGGEMQIQARYRDGHRKWSNVNVPKYRSCQVGEPWPACAPPRPRRTPRGPQA